MNHHHWDSWLHFPLAAAWVSMPVWLNYIEQGGRIATVIIGLIVGLLQIAYLIRKHIHLSKR